MTCCIIFLFNNLNGGDQPVVGVVSGEDRHRSEGLGDVRGESGGWPQQGRSRGLEAPLGGTRGQGVSLRALVILTPKQLLDILGYSVLEIRLKFVFVKRNSTRHFTKQVTYDSIDFHFKTSTTTKNIMHKLTKVFIVETIPVLNLKFYKIWHCVLISTYKH